MIRKGVFGMAKRGFGKFVAFAAVAGAVAAGVSYVLQYKTFHKELEKDFRDIEEENPESDSQEKSEDSADGAEGAPAQKEDSQAKEGRAQEPRRENRNYISLASSRDEFKVAAKDMAQATKNVLRDAGSILSDTAHEAVSAAVDTAHMAIHTVKSKKEEFAGSRGDEVDDSDLFEDEDEGFLDDDYIDDDDLFDYGRLEGDEDSDEASFTAAESEEAYDEDFIKDAAEPADPDPAAYEETPQKTETTSVEEDTAQ